MRESTASPPIRLHPILLHDRLAAAISVMTAHAVPQLLVTYHNTRRILLQFACAGCGYVRPSACTISSAQRNNLALRRRRDATGTCCDQIADRLFLQICLLGEKPSAPTQTQEVGAHRRSGRDRDTFLTHAPSHNGTMNTPAADTPLDDPKQCVSECTCILTPS